jgi:hypothetical protein
MMMLTSTPPRNLQLFPCESGSGILCFRYLPSVGTYQLPPDLCCFTAGLAYVRCL